MQGTFLVSAWRKMSARRMIPSRIGTVISRSHIIGLENSLFAGVFPDPLGKTYVKGFNLSKLATRSETGRAFLYRTSNPPIFIAILHDAPREYVLSMSSVQHISKMKIHAVYLSGVLVKSSMSIPIARAERRHLTVPHVNVRPAPLGTRIFLSTTTMSCGCGGGGGEERLCHTMGACTRRG